MKGRAIYSNGTSTICDYLQYKGMAKCLVPVASMEDLMQAVFRGAEPRGLYAGIEKIKDGFAYDKRYNYCELRTMEPHISRSGQYEHMAIPGQSLLLSLSLSSEGLLLHTEAL